ncbi:MAG: site-2 protease family protein [Candidatus Dormibacteraeota bacterium]|nr:site-2 protease family protein [Candidatus Dormibacteraeota bacterium]
MSGALSYLVTILYTLPGALVGLVVHELAHSAIALRAGDPTPRRQHRMTLDPRRQVDAFGFASLFITGFGWGRPVHPDPRYLRTAGQRAAVAAAGPVANLVVAAVFAVTLRLELVTSGIDLNGFSTLASRTATGILVGVLLQGFFINVALFIYNALPLPGLDGYRVVRELLFTHTPRIFLWLEANRYVVYAAVILVVVVLPELTNHAINPLAAATVGTATLIVDHALIPGVTPIFLGLPNLFQLVGS